MLARDAGFIMPNRTKKNPFWPQESFIWAKNGLLRAIMVPQKTKCFLGYHKSCICYKIDLFSLSLFGPRKLYLLQKEWVKEGYIMPKKVI